MSLSTHTQPLSGQREPARPGLPSARISVLGLALLTAWILGSAILETQGLSQGSLFGIGLLLGYTLYHARFGFTSAFRQLLSVGQGAGLRAHMLMLSVACLLFAPILSFGIGFFGVTPEPYVSPVGVSVLVGAFLFGIGMQLGGGCASGTLYAVGGGSAPVFITLLGFIAGSVIGAWHWGFWTALPALPPISLAESTGLGYGGALAVQLAVFAGIAGWTIWVARRKNPPVIKPVPSGKGWIRVFRGAWPLWVGALLLAGLNALTLTIKGKPWGITSAFALWGSKVAAAFGVDVSQWAYWSGEKAADLEKPILADPTSVMNFGIILGAMLAAAAAGTYAIRKVPGRIALASVCGGLLMGYGARLAYGCNIGAYFGGIASFSLHGWAWIVMALIGTFVGLRFRSLFGMKNPQPKDSVC
ncbi:hypothetical protein C8P63_104213 [Melghirimyces profundicolus]|uniref:Uncharacterized protein n=1 Tax=Melghirimyces profundicolus TaxID=1242148 RepID=A0A2T6C4X3_9BACL|nr:hypothetical protein C8P63_104213 [Melghirimyces profundicolus]